MTLGELVDRYLAHLQAAPGTIRSRRSQLRAIARVEVDGVAVTDLDTSLVDPVVVQTVYDEIAAGQNGDPSPHYASHAVGLIRQAWTWGARKSRRLVPEGSHPCSDVESPRPRSVVPEIRAEVVRALWDATFVVRANPQITAFLRGLMLIGLRPWSEALVMDCSQLFRSGNRWAIRMEKHKTSRRSGAKVRSLGAQAAALLLEQRDRVGGKGPLWPRLKGNTGATMHKASVKAGFRLVVEEASKHVDLDQRIYTYCLRHGFATSALEAGATLTEVQAALGHDSVQSTLRYLHTVPGKEGETADRVSALVVEGVGVTLEDLAHEIGCEPTVPAMVAAVRRAREALGLEQLSEIAKMSTSTPTATTSAWNHGRFLALCSQAEIVNAAELARRIDTFRAQVGAPTDKGGRVVPMDARTASRYWRGERTPDAERMIELANMLGASLDYLTGRDEFLGVEVSA